MKIALSRVHWVQNTSAGNDHGKSLSTNDRRKLWCVDLGILIEQDNKPDELVPMGQVAVMVPAEGKWPRGAQPFDEIRREPTGIESVAALEAKGLVPAGSLRAQLEDMAAADTERREADALLAAKKRGPGRPPKVQA